MDDPWLAPFPCLMFLCFFFDLSLQQRGRKSRKPGPRISVRAPLTSCAAETCAVRPVFARVAGEPGAAAP